MLNQIYLLEISLTFYLHFPNIEFLCHGCAKELLFNWLLVVNWICEQFDLMGTFLIYILMLFLPLNV